MCFFLAGFSFTNIHDSKDSKGRARLSLKLLTTTSTRFINTQILAGRLLQRAQLFRQLQQDPNLKPLVSERKSLTAKPLTIQHKFQSFRDLVPFVQFKKRKNTHGRVLLLVKLQTSAFNFTKSNTPPWCRVRF